MAFFSVALFCWLLLAPAVAWTQQNQRDAALTLPFVVQQVLAAHPLTQAARARVETALGLSRQAKAFANPSFTFTNNDFTFERTYTFNQPLEWPFKRAYRIGVAEAEQQLAEGEQAGVRQEVIAAAREAFFTLLLAQEENRIAEAFAVETRNLQKSTERLVAEGDAAEFEAVKVQVEALRAETEVEKSQGRLKTAESGLNMLLARPDNAPLALQGTLVPVPSVSPLEEIAALADGHSASVIAQRRVLEREQLNLKLVISGLVPDVAIDVGHGEDRKAGITGPVVGLSLSLPLWDWKVGAIAAARSKVTEAEALLRAVQLQVRQSVVTAYRLWETANGQVRLFEKGLVGQAEQAAALAELSYREGEGDLLGVLDAERSLLNVRRDYAQALFAAQLSWVTLERIAGIGTEQ